ncbi:hypothetical protein Hdeb2414_s0019g00545271 [Helianthus debilis subsp. tardiflorus]
MIYFMCLLKLPMKKSVKLIVSGRKFIILISIRTTGVGPPPLKLAIVESKSGERCGRHGRTSGGTRRLATADGGGGRLPRSFEALEYLLQPLTNLLPRCQKFIAKDVILLIPGIWLGFHSSMAINSHQRRR